LLATASLPPANASPLKEAFAVRFVVVFFAYQQMLILEILRREPAKAGTHTFPSGIDNGLLAATLE